MERNYYATNVAGTPVSAVYKDPAVGLIDSISKGEPPSNAQLIHLLAVSRRAIDKQEPDLNPEGVMIAEDLKAILRDVADFIVERNKHERMQDVLRHGLLGLREVRDQEITGFQERTGILGPRSTQYILRAHPEMRDQMTRQATSKARKFKDRMRQTTKEEEFGQKWSDLTKTVKELGFEMLRSPEFRDDLREFIAVLSKLILPRRALERTEHLKEKTGKLKKHLASWHGAGGYKEESLEEPLREKSRRETERFTEREIERERERETLRQMEMGYKMSQENPEVTATKPQVLIQRSLVYDSSHVPPLPPRDLTESPLAYERRPPSIQIQKVEYGSDVPTYEEESVRVREEPKMRSGVVDFPSPVAETTSKGGQTGKVVEERYVTMERPVNYAKYGHPSLRPALYHPPLHTVPRSNRPSTPQPVSSIGDTKEKRTIERDVTVSEFQDEELISRFHDVLRSLSSRSSFRQTMIDVFSLLKHLHLTATSAWEEIGGEKKITLGPMLKKRTSVYTTNPNLSYASTEAILFFEDILGGKSLAPLQDSFKEFFYNLSHDEESKNWFNNLTKYITTTLKEPDLLQSQEHLDYGTHIIRRGRSLAQTHKWSPAYQNLSDNINYLLNTIREDPLLSRLNNDISRFVEHIMRDENGKIVFKPSALGQLKGIMAGVLAEQLRRIPLPPIYKSDPSMDFSLSNVVIYSEDLIPDKIRIAMNAITDLSLIKISPQGYNNIIVIDVRDIYLHIRDAHFSVVRHKFPRIVDDGLLNIDITGRGAALQIVLRMDSLMNEFFEVERVICDIDRLRFNTIGARHRTLYRMAGKLMGKTIKKRVERAVEDKVMELLISLNSILKGTLGGTRSITDLISKSFFKSEGREPLKSRFKKKAQLMKEKGLKMREVVREGREEKRRRDMERELERERERDRDRDLQWEREGRIYEGEPVYYTTKTTYTSPTTSTTSSNLKGGDLSTSYSFEYVPTSTSEGITTY